MSEPHGWRGEDWASDDGTRRLKAKLDFFFMVTVPPGESPPQLPPWRCPRCGTVEVGLDGVPPPPGDCDAAVVRQVMGA